MRYNPKKAWHILMLEYYWIKNYKDENNIVIICWVMNQNSCLFSLTFQFYFLVTGSTAGGQEEKQIDKKNLLSVAFWFVRSCTWECKNAFSRCQSPLQKEISSSSSLKVLYTLRVWLAMKPVIKKGSISQNKLSIIVCTMEHLSP